MTVPKNAWTRRAALGGLSCFALSARAETKSVRLGLTPVFLDNDAAVLEALRSYLKEAFECDVAFVKRRSYREITDLARLGEVDAVWTCGFPYMANREALSLAAVPLWQSEPLYRAYLIAPAGRRIAGYEDIEGDLHAFSDPDSNSGWLVTQSELVRMGHDPDAFLGRSIFTWSHRNVVRAVATGLAASGSVDGYVWEALRRAEPELTDATRVVWRSEPMGFPPVVVPRGHDAAAWRDALLAMRSHPSGAAALERLQLDGFVPGDPGLYAPIKDRMRLLGLS